MIMRDVTMDDVNACIREYGLLGWSTSDLRQLVREASPHKGLTHQIRQAAARHVLVTKLGGGADADAAHTANEVNATALGEYTRLHMELAEMLSSGRICIALMKDDHHRLLDALERINRARRANGLNEVPLDSDEP